MPALRPCDARPEGWIRLHLRELRVQGFLLLLNDVLSAILAALRYRCRSLLRLCRGL
jgi:hypothetical protein